MSAGNPTHKHDKHRGMVPDDQLADGTAADGDVPISNGDGTRTWGSASGVTDHGALTGLSDDDHPQYATNTEFDSHASRHEAGGADEIDVTGLTGAGSPADILDIPTAETDDSLVLAPDGAGGVEFRAEAAGGSGTLTTVKDEGSNLSTAVVSLDFVGAGVTATGTTAVTVTIPGGGGGLSSGTSFPGSPSDGDLFYRTDLDLLCRYRSTGTRWVCTCLHEATFGVPADQPSIDSTTSGYRTGRLAVMTAHDMWVESFVWQTIVKTTNDGSRFWTVNLNKYTPAGAGTTLVSPTTAADTAGQFVTHTTAVGALVQSSTHAMFQVEAAKTSTPGSIAVAAVLTYRLVVA